MGENSRKPTSQKITMFGSETPIHTAASRMEHPESWLQVAGISTVATEADYGCGDRGLLDGIQGGRGCLCL